MTEQRLGNVPVTSNLHEVFCLHETCERWAGRRSRLKLNCTLTCPNKTIKCALLFLAAPLPPLVFPSNLPSYFLFGETTPSSNPATNPSPPSYKACVMFRASVTQSVSCRSVCALKRALAFAVCFLAPSCLCFCSGEQMGGIMKEQSLPLSVIPSSFRRHLIWSQVRLSDARTLFALRRRLERKQFARSSVSTDGWAVHMLAPKRAQRHAFIFSLGPFYFPHFLRARH